MKKLAFFAVCALAIASCTDGVKQANLAAEAQRDSLNSIIAQKESEITDMMTTLSDIEEGFREITEAQSRVTLAKQGEGTNSAQRIRENMQFIQQTLLLPNRVRVPTAHSVSVRTCSLSSRQ